MIDNDTAAFPAELVRSWKRAAEAEALVRIGKAEIAEIVSRGEMDSIRIAADGTVSGVDESFVEYVCLLIKDARAPDLRFDIHRDALREAFPIPIEVYDRITSSSLFHAILDRMNSKGAQGPSERALYVEMRAVSEQLNALECEMRQGILEILTRPAISRWVTTPRDAAMAVSGYISRFFNTSTTDFRVELFMLDDEPRWRLYMSLSNDEAAYLHRSGRIRCGPYLDWSHDMLMSKLVPAILYRAIHRRELLDPPAIPDCVFDFQLWTWFFAETDPGWRRIARSV